jgi:glycosyltransferase involved in cell wall biosynthesis
VHTKLGYDAAKIELIYNGSDTTLFKPDPSARAALRASLAIPVDAPVVGFVGRCVPAKDLPTFLKAAALVQQQLPDTHFVLCGPNLQDAPECVHQALRTIPNYDQVHFLAFRSDVAQVHPSFDLLALTSLSEACPMSLIEAMCCGVPCATTDVGDAAFIIDRPDSVSPVGDVDHIAATWIRTLTASPQERARLSEHARQRAQAVFSLPACVDRYQTLYRTLAHHQTARDPSTFVESNVMP